MAMKKRAPAKRQGKVPAPSMFQRVSTALNPMTYTKKPASEAMSGWNEQYGGGARTRQMDKTLEEATGERRRR
jgi:hypothetical protein